jgi:hypothetical protein
LFLPCGEATASSKSSAKLRCGKPQNNFLPPCFAFQPGAMWSCLRTQFLDLSVEIHKRIPGRLLPTRDQLAGGLCISAAKRLTEILLLQQFDDTCPPDSRAEDFQHEIMPLEEAPKPFSQQVVSKADGNKQPIFAKKRRAVDPPEGYRTTQQTKGSS